MAGPDGAASGREVTKLWRMAQHNHAMKGVRRGLPARHRTRHEGRSQTKWQQKGERRGLWFTVAHRRWLLLSDEVKVRPVADMAQWQRHPAPETEAQ